MHVQNQHSTTDITNDNGAPATIFDHMPVSGRGKQELAARPCAAMINKQKFEGDGTSVRCPWKALQQLGPSSLYTKQRHVTQSKESLKSWQLSQKQEAKSYPPSQLSSGFSEGDVRYVFKMETPCCKFHVLLCSKHLVHSFQDGPCFQGSWHPNG
jgi:hypothetical protein